MNVNSFIDMVNHLKPKSNDPSISQEIRFVFKDNVYNVKLFSVHTDGQILIQLKDKKDCNIKDVENL